MAQNKTRTASGVTSVTAARTCANSALLTTQKRATLIYVATTRNITLALPEGLLRKTKVLAAERQTSVSRLLTDVLEALVAREEGYEQAKSGSLSRLDRAHDLGTEGRVRWSREELHGR